MFGSKKSELTRKYERNWLASITFGFHRRRRVAYSPNAIATNTSDSATVTRRHHSSSRAVHSSDVSSLSSSANGM